MRPRAIVRALAAAALVVTTSAAMGQPTPQRSFTYQGQLQQGGGPFTGTVNMVFSIHDAPVGGAVLYSEVQPGVVVTNGLFNVIIGETNFVGVDVFDGERWLEIRVGLEVLTPRQRVTAAPFAITAAQACDRFFIKAAPNSVVEFGDPNCSIGVLPNLPGLQLRDPRCIRVINPLDPLESKIVWGPTDDCSIGIFPGLPGLTETDPTGFRLLGPGGQGCRLIFGPTLDCTVEVNPDGPDGLTLRDVRGVRLLNPDAAGAPRLLFGPTDDCTIGLEPGLTGLVERDPTGFRLLGQDNQGCRLLFGPTDLCTVEVDPGGPPGLLLRDPNGIRILDPDPTGLSSPTLLFGPTDECTIGIDPNFSGLVERDPTGFRLLGQNNQGCRLLFGPTDDCTIEVNPEIPGLQLRDPIGIRVIDPGNPIAGELGFGEFGECRIRAGEPVGPQGTSMIFTDPRGFFFEGGPVFGEAFIPISSARYKENIEPINGALSLATSLQGVWYDWKPEYGDRHDLGFIAEDVRQVIPELVPVDVDGNAEGVNYAKITAIAIEAIKEQQAQIEALKKSNQELQDRLLEVDSLREQMAALAAQVKTLRPVVDATK